MKKILKFAEDANPLIEEGVSAVSRAVGETMGPAGKCVLIQRPYGNPWSTRDGVTVAREIRFQDQFVEMGAAMVRQASMKTNDEAGDGTSATAVLAGALYGVGKSLIEAGIPGPKVRDMIEKAAFSVASHVASERRLVNSLDEMKQIARISSNEPELGDQLAEAVFSAGKDGSVTVEEGRAGKTVIEKSMGLRLNRGWVSPYLMSDASKGLCSIDNAAVFILQDKLNTLDEIAVLLETAMSQGFKSFLVIADDFSETALGYIIKNRIEAGIPILAVKAPEFGDDRENALGDVAAVTGCSVIGAKLGVKLQELTPEQAAGKYIGKAGKVISYKDYTIIQDGAGSPEEIAKRVETAKAQLSVEESDWAKNNIRSRIGRLTGGVTVVKVGGLTETEVKERVYRAEDAVSACRAALEGGYVIGGGMALLKASFIKDVPGVDDSSMIAISQAFHEPFLKICENSGWTAQHSPTSLVAQAMLAAEGEGLDATTGQWVNLFEAGIIDPARAVTQAALNAASVAGLLLNVSAAVGIVPDEDMNPANYKPYK